MTLPTRRDAEQDGDPHARVTRTCAPSTARLLAAHRDAREQLRFERICARELLGEID